jgi:hypothetical protein
MPSITHEAIVNLLRENPLLLANLAANLDGDDPLRVPDGASVRPEESVLNDINPAEYRSDGILSVRGPQGEPVRAGVFEVQLQRDDDKPYSWPAYVVNARYRLRCPVSLIVVAIDRAVARWCARPIAIGHEGFVLRPIVIGPDAIPAVTVMDEARASPELAVLSVAAHGRDEGAEKIALAALGAAAGLDKEQGELYADFIYLFLSDAVRVATEDLMQQGSYEFKSDFARGYMAKGEARGKAEGLLVLLEFKGFAVPGALRERILGCTDLDQINTWYGKVKSAARLEDVFDSADSDGDSADSALPDA